MLIMLYDRQVIDGTTVSSSLNIFLMDKLSGIWQCAFYTVCVLILFSVAHPADLGSLPLSMLFEDGTWAKQTWTHLCFEPSKACYSRLSAFCHSSALIGIENIPAPYEPKY